MMPTPDLADIITLAETAGAKVVVAEDTEQLQAVQNGGGMSLLADRLGYIRRPSTVGLPRLHPWRAGLHTSASTPT